MLSLTFKVGEKLNLFLNKFIDCGLTISGVMIEKDEKLITNFYLSGIRMVSAYLKLTEILLISFQNRRILKHLPQKLDTIIDVGAHEGQMFISLNKFKTEFNKIIVFEPFKESFENYRT